MSVLFVSSMLNLAELLALRPDLVTAKKIVYFHENQLEVVIIIIVATNNYVIVLKRIYRRLLQCSPL